MTRIALIAFDGFTDLDLFLHWDLLNRPRLVLGEDRPRSWSVRLLGTAAHHVSVAGLGVAMHGSIDEAREADVVLVSGGGASARRLSADPDYIARLGLAPERQILASQCSGALILAAAGALEGLSATTYPSAAGRLAEMGVQVVARPFVGHDRPPRHVATAAGCLAGVDLDRWILNHLIGPRDAELCLDSAAPIGAGLAAVSVA